VNESTKQTKTPAKGPVLVTGGTGFLGEHLVRTLVERSERGRTVRVLSREPTKELRELGVSVFAGDLLTGINRAQPSEQTSGDEPNKALVAALDGVKEVYHLAGLVSRDPSRSHQMMQIHVDATRELLHACKKAGVRRVLLASTSGTIAISRDPEPIPDETWPYPVDLCGEWPYYLSKIYQEKLALRLAKELGLELVVVNPSLLLGPGDRRGSSTLDVRRFLCGEIPAVPLGGINFVDVRDVAPACLAAMERGRDGQRYLLGGPNWTFAEFLGRLSRMARVDGPVLKIPSRWKGLWKGAVEALDELYKHREKTSPIDRISFEMSQHFWYCDSSLAEKELGFAIRDPAETLDDTVRDVRKKSVY
jgi:dihydroflavonol-4-reductase